MKKPTDEQKRIYHVMCSTPYGAGLSPQLQNPAEITLASVGAFLEALGERLRDIAEVYQADKAKLMQLQNDVAAVRRLFNGEEK